MTIFGEIRRKNIIKYNILTLFKKMRTICLFCGSNLGTDSIYKESAKELGKVLVFNNFNLVYGGANVGLMRVVAEEMLNHNKKVTGVITEFLAKKHLTQSGITELITVKTMHQRKAKMAELADAFIVLPGGYGTLEELFEILTGGQLSFHNKPVAIINVNGYYDFLQKQLERMVNEKMLLKPHAGIANFVKTPQQAVEIIKNYEYPVVNKWIDDIIDDNKD
jgi:uncharacterized protein (TIGR00730 family)